MPKPGVWRLPGTGRFPIGTRQVPRPFCSALVIMPTMASTASGTTTSVMLSPTLALRWKTGDSGLFTWTISRASPTWTIVSGSAERTSRDVLAIWASLNVASLFIHYL